MKMNKTETQNKRIKAHLDEGKTLTSMHAFYVFDSLRLAARIFDLKELGMKITKEMVNDKLAGKRYAKYMKVV